MVSGEMPLLPQGQGPVLSSTNGATALQHRMLRRRSFVPLALTYHSFRRMPALHLPHRKGSYLEPGTINMLNIKGVINLYVTRRYFKNYSSNPCHQNTIKLS